MPTLSLERWLVRLGAGLLVAVILGAAAAWAAARLGDDGPRHDGRVSLYPFRHVDFLGLLAFLVLGYGWCRPVDHDSGSYKRPALYAAFVAISGPVALTLLAAVVLVARRLIVPGISGNAALALSAFSDRVTTIALATSILNLLPVHPLSASRVLDVFAPKLAAKVKAQQLWIGMALIAVCLWAPFGGMVSAAATVLRAGIVAVLP